MSQVCIYTRSVEINTLVPQCKHELVCIISEPISRQHDLNVGHKAEYILCYIGCMPDHRNLGHVSGDWVSMAWCQSTTVHILFFVLQEIIKVLLSTK